MAVSRSLRRLLRVLELEEEQCQLALDSALGRLKRLERALEAAAERDRTGRLLVTASAHSGEVADRLAGLEETRLAARRAQALAPRIGEAQQQAAALRAVFLAKRVERRQVETLIQEAEARDARQAGRRSQQALDDRHLHRFADRAKPAQPAEPPADGAADGRPNDAKRIWQNLNENLR